MRQTTLVLGVIGADCHAVGNKILERIFTEEGFRVVNLGVMVSQDEFIDAALETGAGAMLVSSLYGQGELDCDGLRDRCVERGLQDILLYVGGEPGHRQGRLRRDGAEVQGHGLRPRLQPPPRDLREVARLLRDDLAA